MAIAKAAAREGARLVLSSRSGAAIEQALDEIRSRGGEATALACDVGDLEQVEALGEHAARTYGRFDVWINNAGYAGPYGPAMHIAPSAILQVVNTNIIGSYNGSLVALRSFLPESRGKLINVLGRGSDGKPEPMQTAYAASKTWLRSFTLGMAEAYKDTGVGIFAVQPGMMSTELLTDVQVVSGYEKRLRVMPTIIRMWAEPPEVPAEKVVWLASPATDGKSGLIVLESGMLQIAGGALREGMRRLLRRPTGQASLSIQTVPATLPLPNRRGPGIGPSSPGERNQAISDRTQQ
jgi:NAD(P)-dependent dehydrogenase (short-subunit alcohol dehydrogenase family)